MKRRSVFAASFRGNSAVSAATMLILGAFRYIGPSPAPDDPLSLSKPALSLSKGARASRASHSAPSTGSAERGGIGTVQRHRHQVERAGPAAGAALAPADTLRRELRRPPHRDRRRRRAGRGDLDPQRAVRYRGFVRAEFLDSLEIARIAPARRRSSPAAPSPASSSPPRAIREIPWATASRPDAAGTRTSPS